MEMINIRRIALLLKTKFILSRKMWLRNILLLFVALIGIVIILLSSETEKITVRSIMDVLSLVFVITTTGVIALASLGALAQYSKKIKAVNSYIVPASLSEKFFTEFVFSFLIIVAYVLFFLLLVPIFVFVVDIIWHLGIFDISEFFKHYNLHRIGLEFALIIHSVGFFSGIYFKKNHFIGYLIFFALIAVMAVVSKYLSNEFGIQFNLFNIPLYLKHLIISFVLWTAAYVVFRKRQLK